MNAEQLRTKYQFYLEQWAAAQHPAGFPDCDNAYSLGFAHGASKPHIVGIQLQYRAGQFRAAIINPPRQEALLRKLIERFCGGIHE